MRRVGLGPLLLAEDPGGGEHDVEVTEFGDRLLDQRRRRPASSAASHGSTTTSAPGTATAASAAGSRPASATRAPGRRSIARERRQRQLGRAAEDEDGLHAAEGVVHRCPSVRRIRPVAAGQRRDSRRARSDCSDRSGSRLARTLRHSSSRGIHRGQQVGAQPAVLGQVDPAAGGDDQLVQAVEQRAEPVERGGDVHGQRPARLRERQRPVVGRAEPLQHGEERRALRAPDSRSSAAAHRLLGLERHGELVLDEARAGRRSCSTAAPRRAGGRRTGSTRSRCAASAPCGTRPR